MPHTGRFGASRKFGDGRERRGFMTVSSFSIDTFENAKSFIPVEKKQDETDYPG
jgi:hypothetical protein